MIIKGEKEKNEDGAVAYFKILSQDSLGGTTEMNFRQGIRCLG
jgi:hypothetical protein